MFSRRSAPSPLPTTRRETRRSLAATMNSSAPAWEGRAAIGTHGVGSVIDKPSVAAEHPTQEGLSPMKKLLAVSLAALAAGLNVGFAADEKKPEDASPPLQSMHIAPERSPALLAKATQSNAREAQALEEI